MPFLFFPITSLPFFSTFPLYPSPCLCPSPSVLFSPFLAPFPPLTFMRSRWFWQLLFYGVLAAKPIPISQLTMLMRGLTKWGHCCCCCRYCTSFTSPFLLFRIASPSACSQTLELSMRTTKLLDSASYRFYSTIKSSTVRNACLVADRHAPIAESV